MTDKLSDASPLTYEKINQIIGKLNEIEGRIVDVTRSAYPLIDVILQGQDVNRKNTKGSLTPIQISADSKNINVNTNDPSFEGRVDFVPQFNGDPVVTCTLSVSNYNGIRPTIVVSEVNNSGFKFKINLTDKLSSNTIKMQLNYIAIGYDVSTG